MIWIKLLKKLFKALNADASPSEIAGGVVLGALIGLTPALTLQKLFIIILIIVLKVNISSAVFSMVLFGVMGFVLDPLLNFIGTKLLLNGSLYGLWAALYNTPVIPLTRFNNTVVLGSLMVYLIILIPLFIFTKKFVVIYREKLQERVQKFKIVKLLKASKIYKLYTRFKS